MLEWIIGGVACLVAAPYVLLPMVIKNTMTLSAQPEFRECRLESLPEAVAKFFDNKSRQLAKLGFRTAAILECPQAGSAVRNYIVIMLNDDEKALGLINAVVGIVRNLDTELEDHNVRTHYIEFLSKFNHEEQVSTMNSPSLGSFPARKGRLVLQVPQIQDDAKLWQLHKKAAARFGKGKIAEYPKIADWGPYVGNEIARQYKWVADHARLLELDESGKNFKTTWLGAYRMTIAELWPVKPMRIGGMHRRAAAIENEYSRG